MLGSSRVLSHSSRGDHGRCRSTTSFLLSLSKTHQFFMFFYSLRPVYDASPSKPQVFNGLDYLFHYQTLHSPTFFKPSRRDATTSKPHEEFNSSNVNAPGPIKLIKESCFGSMSSQPAGNVSKPIKRKKTGEEADHEFAAEVSEWKKSVQACIKLSEWDEEILEWSLIEIKKLEDKVLHNCAKIEKIQRGILSSIAQVKKRQNKFLHKQEKTKIMLSEIYDCQNCQKKILARLATQQDSTGLSTSKAKIRKMEETMKRILVSQLKLAKVEDTILRAHLKCYEMEEQIRQRLEEMEATQRRNIFNYEKIEDFRNPKKGTSSWGRRIKYLVLLSGGVWLSYKLYQCLQDP